MTTAAPPPEPLAPPRREPAHRTLEQQSQIGPRVGEGNAEEREICSGRDGGHDDDLHERR